MNDARLGIVQFQFGDRTIPLRFTWERIDVLGRNGVAGLIAAADAGAPGDARALATLLQLSSGGELDAEELMVNPPSLNKAFVAVLEAWALALHGPAMEPKEKAENPPNRLWTRLKRLCRRLLGQD